MTRSDNLPSQLTDQSLATSSGKHQSLVTRGMLALSKEGDDAIYRQARKTFNEITDNGSASWYGHEERKAPLAKLFKVFQELATKGYGKAFFPLSTIYQGEQSVEGDEDLAKYYRERSFNWLHSNEHLNDPEIWCDLGVLYIHDDNQLAVHYFKKGADVGDPDCMWMLSSAYEYGIGVEENDEESRHWQIKAAIGGHSKAQHGLEVQHNRGDLDIDDEQVFDWYIWSAEQGYVWAQVVLAHFYFDDHIMGNIGEVKDDSSYYHDEKQAVYWYEKAAIQGDTHSQLELAKMYWKGLSCLGCDNDKAKYWLEKSIEDGSPESQYQLAIFLLETNEKNWNRALQLLESLMINGYGRALYYCVSCLSLGFFDEDFFDEILTKCPDLIGSALSWYENNSKFGGDGLRLEHALLHLDCWDEKFNMFGRAKRLDGLSLLRKIASESIVLDDNIEKLSLRHDVQRRACKILGLNLLTDSPSPETASEAIHWLSQAADMGDSFACIKLAELYLYGHAGVHTGFELEPKIVEIDHKLAVFWYERDIQRGHGGAAYELGIHYLEGKHLPQNLVLAEKWLLHAAEAGCDLAIGLLGSEYASGIRFKQNVDSAIYWLELASGYFINSGSLKLAEIYFDGEVVLCNFDEAMKWLSRLRDEGTNNWNDAIRLIAEKCFDGRFDSKQKITAQKWIVETASMLKWQVSSGADIDMYGLRTSALAELYELGLGVEKDIEKAIHWYRKAAEHGSYHAKEHLRELGVENEKHNAS